MRYAQGRRSSLGSRIAVALAAVGLGAAALASCFDAGTRWVQVDEPDAGPAACTPGEMRCSTALERCEVGDGGVPGWTTIDDCAAKGEACVSALLACKACAPGSLSCKGSDVVRCGDDGETTTVEKSCDAAKGSACRAGACVDLCAEAAKERSNVGCEYWAVDLDNAMIDFTSNAAAQQFAVVVSNAQPDVAAEVHIFQDDGAPGDAPAAYEIASATIAPLNLRVFKLGPREVDGSPEGQYNTGSHTALTRHAYEITSSIPVVAYQFNPLENANVFSNDASLLVPREAFNTAAGGLSPAYVVAGWPQTIAITDDPDTNFSAAYPTNLRAFLTIVGTHEGTQVEVHTRTAVVAGGPVPATPKDGVVHATLGPFDVLNLETGDFNADFTGSVVLADAPVAVFSGSEASDAPHFDKLANRRCCADHLEEQLDPLRTAGSSFVLAHTPSRTKAVKAAGADVGVVPEPEYFRFVNAGSKPTAVTTTLPAPDDHFILGYLGDFHEVTATASFAAESGGPISVGQVMASQDAAGVKRGLPGGDPSLVVVPPIEQFRPDYVFLTPDKYAFDFISVVAPPGATVLLDDQKIGPERCDVEEVGPLAGVDGGAAQAWVVYACQLSFPVIDPLKDAPDNVLPGEQHDGVHRLVADAPVGVIVSGFDNYVSYAYAAGTELREIAPPQ